MPYRKGFDGLTDRRRGFKSKSGALESTGSHSFGNYRIFIARLVNKGKILYFTVITLKSYGYGVTAKIALKSDG